VSLRDLAAGAARTSAGLWQGVAEAIEPPHPGPRPVPDPVDLTDAGERPESVDAALRSGDAMLVPIDSWTRVLDQLGNLHEAGQQLAEARERAAKAETEAAFLRQQLGELRRRPAEPTPAPEPGEQRATRASVSGRAVDAAVRTRRRAAVWFRR